MKNETISIRWDNMESSMIEMIHFKIDKSSNKSYLGVVFTSGDSYVYSDVKIEDIIRILISDSAGKTFISSIKNKYPYKNLGSTSKISPLDGIDE